MNTLSPSVLIVEDEPLIAELICDIVDDLSMTSAIVGRADTGLAYLEAHAVNIKLLVTDVRMPGPINGYALAHLVAERWPEIPILISSGYAGIPTTDLPPGAFYLAKPWRHCEMLEALRSLVLRQT